MSKSKPKKSKGSDRRTEDYLAGRIDPDDLLGDEFDDYNTTVSDEPPLAGGKSFQPALGLVSPPRPTCSGGIAGHMGLDKFLKWNKKSIGGAAGRDVAYHGVNLVIDMGGAYKATPMKFVSGPKEFEELNSFLAKPPTAIRIQWEDRSVPPMGIGLAFWRKMWELIPEGHTVFCCIGGHGRTGTALAAMAVAAMDDISAKDAIDMVREDHCKCAIETPSQERYIEALVRERDGK